MRAGCWSHSFKQTVIRGGGDPFTAFSKLYCSLQNAAPEHGNMWMILLCRDVPSLRITMTCSHTYPVMRLVNRMHKSPASSAVPHWGLEEIVQCKAGRIRKSWVTVCTNSANKRRLLWKTLALLVHTHALMSPHTSPHHKCTYCLWHLTVQCRIGLQGRTRGEEGGEQQKWRAAGGAQIPFCSSG